MLPRQVKLLEDAIDAGHDVRFIGEGHDTFRLVDSITRDYEGNLVFELADGDEYTSCEVNAEDFVIPWHPFKSDTAKGELPETVCPALRR